MLDIENRTEFKPPKKAFLSIMKALNAKNIELLIIRSDAIKKINLNYRGVNKPTDVLSFPLEEIPHSPLGSIVLNLDAIAEAANRFGHSEQDEATLLFIHGLLHLLGYDHEQDGGEMRTMEESLVKQFNLPSSLIVRTTSCQV